MAATDFTVADVLTWARTKPADEGYRYGSNTNCALCQFLRETGRALHPSAGSSTWTEWAKAPYFGGVVEKRSIPEAINAAVMGLEDEELAESPEWTFGALVKRLEALCPEAPVTQSDWLAIDTYLNADCGKVEA